MDDRAVVAAQLGREPRAFRRVVVRCPFGRPAVTEPEPYAPDGEPFPTTYWLTCRHLVSAVSRLEAAGGAVVEADAGLRADLERASEDQREIRRELAAGEGPNSGAALELGIGGSRNPAALKCLHAHVAFALARPRYELGEAILEEVPERWPPKCCSDLSIASPR